MLFVDAIALSWILRLEHERIEIRTEASCRIERAGALSELRRFGRGPDACALIELLEWSLASRGAGTRIEHELFERAWPGARVYRKGNRAWLVRRSAPPVEIDESMLRRTGLRVGDRARLALLIRLQHGDPAHADLALAADVRVEPRIRPDGTIESVRAEWDGFAAILTPDGLEFHEPAS